MSNYTIPNNAIPKTAPDSEHKLSHPVLNVDYSKYFENNSKSKKMLFSFSLLNKEHELFNLGCSETKEKHLNSQWYVDFLEQLSIICNAQIADLKSNSSIQLHPLDRKNTNIPRKDLNEQYDYYQFRINKQSRVFGIKIDNVFYVIWLDPHHNHCDSEGYEGVKKCMPVYSYEEQIQKMKEENARLEKELKKKDKEYDDLFNELVKVDQYKIK